MDKEREIEEMAIVLSTEDGSTDDCPDCEHITMCFRQCDAEKLYNEGYRKADDVRKETAKEILQDLYELCKERQEISWDDIYYFVLKYGVDVEE